MDEKKVQDEATLEKVNGGLEVVTMLYRCPKCGRESRIPAVGAKMTQCLLCRVDMELVEGSMQREEF